MHSVKKQKFVELRKQRKSTQFARRGSMKNNEVFGKYEISQLRGLSAQSLLYFLRIFLRLITDRSV